MQQINELKISEYSYDLPESRIAKYPLEKRDQSKLLIYENGVITENQFSNIAKYLPGNSFLVFNNTKVVEARILFNTEAGKTIEIFCLEPEQKTIDITTAMLQKGMVRWRCFIGAAKKWKEEKLVHVIAKNNIEITLEAKKICREDDAYIVELSWNNDHFTFAEILHFAGHIPLPPYLKRDATEADVASYQTVYAKHNGSVAAPTAGLHFTDGIFNSLKEQNVSTGFATLHVGAGTFKPVKTELVIDHEMHAEFIDVSSYFIEQLLQKLGQKIVATGTTSLRTLESLYWIGVKIRSRLLTNAAYSNIEHEDLIIDQWDPYKYEGSPITVNDSLIEVFNWMKCNELDRLITKTRIIIIPGYNFRITDGLITNFHQPGSTLLLLIAAFVGNDWRSIYDYALQNDFRFLSFGDGSLIWKSESKN